MELPTHKFNQSDLLMGMTSSLKDGACLGLTVRWLVEASTTNPSVAAIALTHGAGAQEALISHARFTDSHRRNDTEFDSTVVHRIIKMSSYKLKANPVSISTNGRYIDTAVSMIAAMSDEKSNLALVTFNGIFGYHCIALGNVRNVWTTFDANEGTWTFAGDAKGAPTRYSQLIVDIFNEYQAKNIRFFQTISMF
ncbi:Uncharacterised protein [BD1-7 clade bacterium]|uniref:Peptidase C58 YopT-type domain-containing protein n=1 Tax=BD1-7 clade bacterium TaxID=2029982 RepID=A0A5S9QY18_9GAMM|nr:Uncharacterised protein [BD1-7 clade bacterium]